MNAVRFVDIQALSHKFNDLSTMRALSTKVTELTDRNNHCCLITNKPLWLPISVPYNIITPESFMLEKLRDECKDCVGDGDISEDIVGGSTNYFDDIITITAGDLSNEVDTDIDFLTSKEDINDDNPRIKPTVKEEKPKIEVNDSTVDELIRQQLRAYSLAIPNNLPTILTPNQYLPCLFFVLFNAVKSFILNHGTGVGKTVQGSFVAHSFLNLSPTARVIILILGVTRSQWESQLRQDDITRDHMNKIDLVAYDTSTFGNNISLVRSKLKTKDRVLIIIDEIHIMISRSVPKLMGNERTMKAHLDSLLELTRRGTNKLLLLTGTPFTNSIKEFELYLNILRPNIFKSVTPAEVLGSEVLKRVSDLTQLLRYSVSSLNPQTKFAFSNTEATEDYASKRVIFKRVVMHSYQEEIYKIASEIERKSPASGFRYLTRNYGNFAYKIFVRENMTLEEYTRKRQESIQEFIDIMRSSSKQDQETMMEQCSSEFKSIVDHIAHEQSAKLGMKCVIYVNMMENIDALSAYLDAKNITYFEFSGRTLSTRQDDIKLFNQPDNLRGEKIRVMILSSAGSIGINIYGARRLYFLSQEWTNALSQQIIGRCLRYRYHIDFPVEERELQVYLYFSVLKSETTTDESIFELMKRKFNLLSQALDVIIGASIETSLSTSVQELQDRDTVTTMKPEVLVAINDYLDRKYYTALNKLAYKTETVVRKILYRYADREGTFTGYLSNNKIYTENMILLTSTEGTKVMIEQGKMIYVINF